MAIFDRIGENRSVMPVGTGAGVTGQKSHRRFYVDYALPAMRVTRPLFQRLFLFVRQCDR